MENIEILMQISEDVAEIRAHNDDILRRIGKSEKKLDANEVRIRRLEVVMLPIYAGVGWILIQIYNYLH